MLSTGMAGGVRDADNSSVAWCVFRGMPWSSTDPAKERIKFVLEWERRWDEGEGRMNLSELCREFGVSRDTAYVWIGRYKAAGRKVEALAERSHRPHHSPHRIPEDVVDGIV